MTEATEEPTGSGPDAHRVGLAARIAMALVRGYQRLFSFRPSPCRYVPSCSNYALDAYEYRGVLVGTWLTVRRIVRCNPWGGHGWDPVPGSPAAAHPPHDDSHAADHRHPAEGGVHLIGRGVA